MADELPFEVKDGDNIDAILFNALLALLREKLDKTDPNVPVYDEQLKGYLIGG